VFNTLVMMLSRSLLWASDEQTYMKNRTNQLPLTTWRRAGNPANTHRSPSTTLCSQCQIECNASRKQCNSNLYSTCAMFLTIAKRNIGNQRKYVYIDDRPTDDRPLIPKISNGHISATGHPIHFMFGSRIGFSRSADRMAIYPVRSNPRCRPAAILEIPEWVIQATCMK